MSDKAFGRTSFGLDCVTQCREFGDRLVFLFLRGIFQSVGSFTGEMLDAGNMLCFMDQNVSKYQNQNIFCDFISV